MTSNNWTVEKVQEVMRTHTNPSTLEGFKRKSYCGKGSADIKVAEGAREFVAKITTNSIDRDREIVDPKGIDFAYYRKNPVILWGHNYSEPAIGRSQWIKTWTENGKAKGHISKGVIASGVQKAEDVFNLIQQGILNTTSVGFVPISGHEPTEKEIEADSSLKKVAYIHDKISMLEYSIVNVPANPEATIEAVSKGIIDIPVPLQQEMGIFISEPARIVDEQRAQKKAMPHIQTPMDGVEAGWDLSYEKDTASYDDLMAMCAWVDTGRLEYKAAYKYLHHRAGSGNLAVWQGVAESMSRLNRFMDVIPDDDRKSVWKHLAKHYQEFGKEPPELISKAPSFCLHTINQAKFKAYNVAKAKPVIRVVSEKADVVGVSTSPEILASQAQELFEVDYLGRV